MKRFILALLCVALIAFLSLPVLAEEPATDQKVEKVEQDQKDDAKEDGAKEDAPKEEEAAKEEPKNEDAGKEDAEKKNTEKKEVKDEKKPEAKDGETKKEEPKKEEPKKEEPKTVEVKKDKIHLCVSLNGVFEARKSTPIKLEPKQWSAFKILSTAEHGQKVSRGDLLVTFDPEDIDQAIADGRRALEMARLNLQKAEKEFASFEKMLPTDEKVMARTAKELQENQQWQDEHDQKLVEADLEMYYKMVEAKVEDAREEYRQLKKMYEADDLTEETEEIILKRTKLEMEQAEHFFKHFRSQYDFEKKYGLTRSEQTYEEGKLRDKLSAEQLTALFPLAVELKKITMEKQRIEFEQAEEKFQKLQADRKLMTIKAPCDGVVYYGSCTRGKWSGAASETLEEDKAIGPKKVFMTIVRTDSLQVRSAASEKDLSLLREGLKATARAAVLPETQLQLLIDQVAEIPSNGSFDVVLKIVGKTPEQLVPGMSCEIQAIGYYKKDALVIPVATIEVDPLDDAKQFVYRVGKKGKPKKIQIEMGKVADKKVEILSGLKVGDKILAEPPKDEKK